MTGNQIRYWELQETIRSNKAKERETQRSNLAQEAYNFGTLGENVRHNIQVEGYNMGELGEKVRHSVAVEGETLRSNLANEAIRRDSNSIERSKVGLGYAQLSEAERSNRAQETLKQQSISKELYGIMTNREVQERNQAIQLKNLENDVNRTIIERKQADTAAKRQAAEQEYWSSLAAQGWVKTVTNSVDTTVRLVDPIKKIGGK